MQLGEIHMARRAKLWRAQVTGRVLATSGKHSCSCFRAGRPAGQKCTARAQRTTLPRLCDALASPLATRIWSSSDLICKSSQQGKPDSFGNVLGPQPLHHARAMHLDCALANAKVMCDDLVRMS
jgi:hypothetical protein